MTNRTFFSRRFGGNVLACAAMVLFACVLRARVVDDFNDNTKTGWTDFTFVPGFGLPTEQGGQFAFDLPPAGDDIFTASQKLTEPLELKDGRTIEMRVDLVESSGEDAFAVLAFIPNSPGTLAGYGLAKDPTDVLITKGVGRYFIADDTVTAELTNRNVTLSLTLTAKSGSVTVTGRILDKGNNDAVLWERTVVDTPNADVMQDGDDNPAAPFITTGYFTLYCYQQFNAGISEYKVSYDNAEYFIMEETVLDDFNDNTKTGWTDFTFVPGFGLPTEQGGQFVFDLPPAGDDIFTASQKTSRPIDLTEGERVELQVDLVSGSGEDAFVVLAFIPASPGTLAGYGLAKDPTDVLITKGVGRYFIADDTVTAELLNEDVTLVLTLTAHNGSVTVHARILDKSNNNAVLWERTVVDTPGADVMQDGDDNPAAPFITSGYFTLYCYQQFNAGISEYRVTYDNAILRAAPAATNAAPSLSDILPADFSNFLPASTQISFKVTDDQAIDENLVSVTLNGTKYTKANGLNFSGGGTSRTVTLGGLVANANYAAVLEAADAGGKNISRSLFFDTFAASDVVIEIEDYNFGGGQFINDPIPVAEGGFDAQSYSQQQGTPDVDFTDTRGTPNGTDTPWRPNDSVRMRRSLDKVRAKYTAAGGSAAGVYDYDVGDIAAGEWLNYTRTFAAGTYEVYLRQAVVNMAQGRSVLELVTSDRTQPNQTTRMLGSFLADRSGFESKNTALTDGSGLSKVVVRLSGVTTLRLRQVTPDGDGAARYQNYMIFVPVPDPGTLRAQVIDLSPDPGSENQTVTPTVTASIVNRDTTVNVATVKLEVNDLVVPATVTPNAGGASVQYVLSPLPAPGATNTARLSFKDSENADVVASWTFVVRYVALDPANAVAGKGTGPGFKVRVVQAPEASNLENSLERAEAQLAAGSTIPVAMTTNTVESVINMAQDDRPSGHVAGETIVPGIDPFGNTEDFAVEVQAYLQLATGVYRFNIVSDDGYKLSSGKTLADKDPVLAFQSGTADESVDFVVTAAGLYPFRLIWYERGGNAYIEWTSVNTATSQYTLINDPTSTIKAYTAVEQAAQFNAPSLSGGQLTLSWTGPGTLQEAPAVTGPWTPAASQTNPQTVAASTGLKFYRIFSN